MSAAVLFDQVSRIARHEAAARAIASAAIVTSLHPYEGTPDHAVGVRLRDSGLVLPRVPVAVGALGLAVMPAIGDLVIVAFLEGDYDAPVVVGRLYHPDLDPPKHKAGEIVLRLPAGAAEPALQAELAGEPARIALKLPGEVLVEAVEDKVTLAVKDIAVTLTSGGRLEAKVGDGTLVMKKDGAISLKGKSIRLEASEVEIKGSGTVKVTGGTVELN